MLRHKLWPIRQTLLKSGMYSLFLISIPWYRPPGQLACTFEGFPDWVLTALLCFAIATGINVWLWFAESATE
ncbi:hypothetical protein [Endozoicomonas lisbonensis]|uniref:hypothetical protein n=1 Tax=Endozoicomonas lisbonensis TaxID=3120522 RepID=UPI00339552F6